MNEQNHDGGIIDGVRVFVPISVVLGVALWLWVTIASANNGQFDGGEAIANFLYFLGVGVGAGCMGSVILHSLFAFPVAVFAWDPSGSFPHWMATRTKEGFKQVLQRNADAIVAFAVVGFLAFGLGTEFSKPVAKPTIRFHRVRGNELPTGAMSVREVPTPAARPADDVAKPKARPAEDVSALHNAIGIKISPK